MEGVDCQLNITFDKDTQAAEDSNIDFTADSRTQKLIVVDANIINTKKQISFIFKILSYIVLGVFVASLGHKMLGLELISTCQMIYFSYMLYSPMTYGCTALAEFRFVTGYRTLLYLP